MKFLGENTSARANKAYPPEIMDAEEDVDISDDGDDSDSNSQSNKSGLGRQSNSQYFSQAEKRAHHNALERKRRDHIKDSFTSLRDSVPSLQGEKVRPLPFSQNRDPVQGHVSFRPAEPKS